MSNLKTYLGDSVYVDLSNSGMLILTTENGVLEDPSNEIYIEPIVYRALIKYAEQFANLGYYIKE